MKNALIEKEKPTRVQLAMLIFYTVVIITIIAIDLVFLANFNVNTNIILHNPVPGSKYPPEFTAAGFAWDRDSILKGEDINVTIDVTRISDGKSLSFNAKRSPVYYKDIVLFYRSNFTCPITLEKTENMEEWNIVARMTTPAGYSMEMEQCRIRVDSKAVSHEFQFLSFQHSIALFIILISAILIVIFFRNGRNSHLQLYAAFFLSLIIIGNELAYHIYWYVLGCWTPSTGFMLHMCGLAILLIPYALFVWKKKIQKYLGEIVFFWGLGGALQALLTPDINVHGFPEYKYISFFVSHGAIIICALFIIVVYNIRIGLGAYIRAFFITNGAVVMVYIINQVLKNIAPFEIANYFVVGYPPPDGSVVDFFVAIFGPSPWYIIGLELMGLAVFALLCVPFLFIKKKETLNADLV
ncbi:MAG: TIGR02206 family membrane protein [Spirochaetales bacterium]|nr:TIGR02206 family membrane protein [Spirochaetales bacterium]